MRWALRCNCGSSSPLVDWDESFPRWSARDDDCEARGLPDARRTKGVESPRDKPRGPTDDRPDGGSLSLRLFTSFRLFAAAICVAEALYRRAIEARLSPASTRCRRVEARCSVGTRSSPAVTCAPIPFGTRISKFPGAMLRSRAGFSCTSCETGVSLRSLISARFVGELVMMVSYSTGASGQSGRAHIQAHSSP